MSTKTNLSGRAVYLVDGCRTPFIKARDRRGPFAASDLAVAAGRDLLKRYPLSPQDLDEVIMGCVMPSQDEANIARIIALRLGCGPKMSAWSVQRNCASGMQSIDNAAQAIAMGRSDLVLAGGCEAMSHAPLIVSEAMTNWIMRWFAARRVGQRVKLLTQFRPGHLRFIIALLRGLTDPIVGLNMGQTAENLAETFHITREMMDAFALQSHQRLAQAMDDGVMQEIIPLFDKDGNLYDHDDGLRRDSSLEKLGKLRPVFDRKYGRVTAANSSQVTDGAACCLLASADAVKKFDLPVIAKIVDIEWAALDPAQMGLGPIHAMTPLMQRHKLSLDDIDAMEINEAFAAQVIGCIEAWNNADYCQQQLGLEKAFGLIDQAKLNIDGGAICIGHPVGASGARITLHLANILQRQKAQRGIASICIGGGQGGALLLERVEGV